MKLYSRAKMLDLKEVAKILNVDPCTAGLFVMHSGIDYVCIDNYYRVSSEKLEAFLDKPGCINVQAPYDFYDSFSNIYPQ